MKQEDAQASTQDPAGQRPVRRRRRRGALWLLVLSPVAGLAVVAGVLAVTHQPIAVPRWVVARLEQRANLALTGRMRVAISGGALLRIGDGFMPQIDLKLVQIQQPSGLPLAVLPELRADFMPQPLMRGRLVPRDFRVLGATVALHRLEDGTLDIDLGGGGIMAGLDLSNPGQLTEAVEAVFATPALANLQAITADDLRVRLDDDRLNRVWQVSQGRLDLRQDAARIAVTLAFDIGERGTLPAQVALTATTSKTGPEADFDAAVTDVPARDLAVQSPALALLGLLDAPISGTLHTGIDAQGTLRRLDATLSLGAGALSPVEGAQPIPFEGANMHIGYDPDTRKVTVPQADFTSAALRFRSSSQVYLQDFVRGLPQTAVGQVQLSDIEADPEGLFAEPARFSFGALDLRVHTDPFRVEIGQLQLVEDDTHFSGRGQVSAGADGWRVAFDAAIDRIGRHDLLALWPPRLVPHTRDWIDENIPTGILQNVHASVRLSPGQEPLFHLGYEFRDAEARIVRTLPPVQDGQGFATIFDNSHALMVENGHIDVAGGGRVDVANSTMVVPDIREKPARAEVDLIARAPIPAALSLLDEPPFEFLKKAGKTPDLATGWAEARARLSFLLEKKIAPDDVDFHVDSTLHDVRSDKVVPDRVVNAPLLALHADRGGMSIAGRGMLDLVPFDGRWSQIFGPAEKGHSRIDGYAQVSPEGLRSIGIRLPDTLVKGTGWGKIGVDLHKDATDSYDFATDLRGIALSLPQIGWAKPAATQAMLTLTGTLGSKAAGRPPTVDRIALTAPGLEAEGSLQLSKDGFDSAALDQVKIANWFRGGIGLTDRGAGKAPDIQIRGGTLDLRQLPETGSGGSAPSGGGNGDRGGNRISGTLDRVIVTGGIALTQLRGQFTTQGGLAGGFTAKVNGGAPLNGVIGPSDAGRTAIRVTSEDAGWVAASAHITDRTAGGRMVLTLSPLARHSYEGALHIDDFRVTDAPTLASLLSAASIVGLVEQLNGEGIVFGTVDAAFRLTPDGLSITRAAAQGASMAVTVAGNLFPRTGQIDMEGVVSPLYIINSIGQLVSRRGEGLFGFNYTVQGSVDQPDISVNPLSILTPGGLRELFRRVPSVLNVK